MVLAIGEISLGVDTAVIGGTGTLLLVAFAQVWARTRSVDGQRDAVTQLAMKLAEDMTAYAQVERDHWQLIAENFQLEADNWRERWEKEIAHRTEGRGHPGSPDAAPDRPNLFGRGSTPPAENGDDGTATL